MVRVRDIVSWTLFLGLVLSGGQVVAEPPAGGDQIVVQPEPGEPEALVDDEGTLYKKRPYGGIIPKVRDHFDEGPKSAGEKAPEPIINWTRMSNRRIKMDIGLTYGTTAAQFETILAHLRTFIAEDDRVDHTATEMAHITQFSESSIDINLY